LHRSHSVGDRIELGAGRSMDRLESNVDERTGKDFQIEFRTRADHSAIASFDFQFKNLGSKRVRRVTIWIPVKDLRKGGTKELDFTASFLGPGKQTGTLSAIGKFELDSSMKVRFEVATDH
jgi:hypothetical protein